MVGDVGWEKMSWMACFRSDVVEEGREFERSILPGLLSP
jgi:hypothetical protein